MSTPLRSIPKPPATESAYCVGYRDGLEIGRRVAHERWFFGGLFTGLATAACLMAAVLLVGCTAFTEPMVEAKAATKSLHSDEMEAAIRAANPGVPR